MKRFLTDIEIEDILYFIKPNKSIPLDCTNSIVKITKDKFRKQLIKKEVYPSIIPDLKNIIHKNYQQSLIDAGESVGILAAQSIGERQTQNSIDYDEEIIINVENKIIKTKIGKFIDEYMESFSDCQKLDEYSYVQECKNVKIMTISQDEKIQWQNISEISRHYPKGNLVKVTTESGRSVVSTLSHSHLKKDKRTVVPVLGSELKLGDRIPVIKKSPVPNDIVKRIDITEYLEKYRIGPYEYDSDGNTPLNSPSNNNLEYVYLYGERFRRYIYIDNEFIDFLGIFIANGSLGYHKKQISLSSIGRYDQSIYEIIEKFCLKYDLQFNCNQLGIYFFQSFKNNRTTHYNINSRILYTFITRFLRKDGEKCIPDFIFGLDEDSMKLFLQSYFIEGGFDSEYDSINKDIQFLLTYFGIYSRIVNKKLVIQNQYNHLFYEIFNVKIKEENIEENFHTLDDSLLNKEVIRLQKLIDNIHEEVKITKYEELKNFIENFILESQKQCLTDIPENIEYLTQLDLADVVWEKITKLELIFEKDYKHKYVYDFSVKGNETFALFSGIVVHNTLNSVDWKEKIIYSKNDNIIVEPIGKMIDKLLLKNKENIENIEENRTEYLELKDDKYFIPSCDEYGNTNWYEIEAITKHLPVGKLVKVTTESGRTVMATQSKSFLVWNENEKKFLATAGSDVKLGDILPTTNLLPRLNIKKDDSINYNDIKIILNREIGFVIGLYLTGEIENFLIDEKIKFRLDKLFEHYNFNIYEFLDDITDSGTNIPSFSYNCSEEYIKGLLSGFFRNCEYKNGSILCSSYYEDIINGMLFLLNYYGVFGFFIKTEDEIIYKLEVKSDNTELLEKDVIEEIWKDISKEFMLSNYEISNLGRLKNKKINVSFDKVIHIEYINGTTDYVYDLTVKNTRNFQLFNGLNVRDTFHRAGQTEKSVTVGVPRFQELLNATKNPKMVNSKIFFNNGNKTIKDLRELINHNLVCLTIKDLADSIEVIMNKEEEDWYESFKILYNNKFFEHKNCISIKLNSKLLFKYRLSIQKIANIIENNYDDIFCVFSPISKCQLDIFVDVSNIKFSEEKLLFINADNAEEIYIEECVQPILEKMVICGIPGIQNIYYTIEHGEWFVETDGCNFKKLLGHSIVDMTRLQSNNVWDIYETLGIEAAREFLISEFLSIMEGINTCHVKLLVEKMTYNGIINSISRYTLKKDESGPFSKSSFEESTENFIRSAFSADVEKIKGVSASIICGKRAGMGTGMMDLKINIKQLPCQIPVFKDKNNEGIVIENKKPMAKIKPYSGKL